MSEDKKIVRNSFAEMDPKKQREIASRGGKRAHQLGAAHEWTTEEAREAGRKGGLAVHRRKKVPRDDMEKDPSRFDER